jgi:hypothetical protein
VQGGPQQGALPRADLPGEQDEALAARDSVAEGCEALLVRLGEPREKKLSYILKTLMLLVS